MHENMKMTSYAKCNIKKRKNIEKDYNRRKNIEKTKYTSKKDSDKINADFSRRKVI